MARAIWTGHLSFGLVSIPVAVHIAVRDHQPRFRLLHGTDHTPVKILRVRAHDSKPVAWDDLVKGYEYSRGHYVVLTKDDFRAAAIGKTKRIDILDFVRAEEIDDRFFETPYYLAPAKGGEAAYALLREAMRSTERMGIAKFLLRDKLHLAGIETIDDALVLTLLRFADELVDIKQLDLPGRSTGRAKELDMAKSLVMSLASEWKPEKYTDEYRDNLMRIVRAKAKGKKIVLPAEGEEPKAEVINLMERLRRSLDARQSSRTAAGRRRGSATPRAARSKGATRRKRRAA
jgi:DNA end-binding protein Ku